MGEAKRKGEMAVKDVAQAIGVETMGGRIQVKWDTSSSATPFGQMAFFIEFLKPTLRHAPHDALRMTRGQDDLPFLSCIVSTSARPLVIFARA